MDGSDNIANGKNAPPLVAFDESQQAGEIATTRWLSHPAAATIIKAHTLVLLKLVPPALAPNQVAVTDLGRAAGVWPVVGAWWLRPDGVPTPDPDEPQFRWPVLVHKTDPRLISWPWMAGWPMLPETDRARRHAHVGKVRAALVALAKDLAGAGVPVDPGSALDICVLAQLTTCDFDLSRPAAELVADLNLGAPFALSMDGRDVRNIRDGTSVRVETAATRIRRWSRAEQDDDAREAVRNRGGRPEGSASKASKAKTLAFALPQVLARFPTVTAARLSESWRRDGDTPGRMLRDLMGKTAADPLPSKRTLERALKKIRAQ